MKCTINFTPWRYRWVIFKRKKKNLHVFSTSQKFSFLQMQIFSPPNWHSWLDLVSFYFILFFVPLMLWEILSLSIHRIILSFSWSSSSESLWDKMQRKINKTVAIIHDCIAMRDQLRSEQTMSRWRQTVESENLKESRSSMSLWLVN